jgi:putative tryptophan/tyrosine transport system substrate-binding protein
MKRRDFMMGMGFAVALPAIARAQQTMPTIGFLLTRSSDEAAIHAKAFRSGLEEMGYVEGKSVAIEYRWAQGDYSKLPGFAAELKSKPLSLMVTAGDPAALAAKAAAPSVPIVFLVGGDPVQSGLVASMNRPGAMTGVNFFTGELGSKRLELLCAMAPSAHVIGSLVNPRFGGEAAERQRQLQTLAAAARELGRELVVQEAATDAAIEAAFAAFAGTGITGLIVQNDPFFDSRRSRIVALAAGNHLPGIFHIREYPSEGGLMSYGASLSDTYRQLGVYAGKVLRGAKPDDLPVLRPTKFELVINTRTARTLGLTVPQSMQIAADELIE